MKIENHEHSFIPLGSCWIYTGTLKKFEIPDESRKEIWIVFKCLGDCGKLQIKLVNKYGP